MKGRFITFEGIDGSGKSTQIRRCSEWLADKGVPVLITRQPGGTQIGKEIRKLLTETRYSEIVPETEIMLFLADRIQHIREVIEPAIREGKTVLCDRYHDSTLAYQVGGRQLSFGWLDEISEKLILSPDITLWLDLPVETAQNRLHSRASQEGESNRLDQEKLEFYERVAGKYRELAANNAERYIKVQADQSETAIFNEIQQHLNVIFP